MLVLLYLTAGLDKNADFDEYTIYDQGETSQSQTS